MPCTPVVVHNNSASTVNGVGHGRLPEMHVLVACSDYYTCVGTLSVRTLIIRSKTSFLFDYATYWRTVDLACFALSANVVINLPWQGNEVDNYPFY